MSENFKFNKSAIEWRRNTVLSKLARGMSQSDIAKELQLHPSTISLDVQYLKEQAKEELQTHISNRLPFEYARAVTGINSVLKRVSEMLDEAKDPKVKTECLKLQMELYKSIMSLATDGGIVERCMKLVKGLESQQYRSENFSPRTDDETKLQNNRAKSPEEVRTTVIEDSSEDDADIVESEEDIPTEPEEDLKEEE
jgi:hypothetical protein